MLVRIENTIAPIKGHQTTSCSQKETNFEVYLNSYSFRFVQPQTPFPTRLFPAVMFQVISHLGFSFDVLNTILPNEELPAQRKLNELCKITRGSTYAIGSIINQGVSMMKEGEVFLNVGVWHGFSFLAGLIENQHHRCIGVDKFCTNEKVDGKGNPEYHGIGKLLRTWGDKVAKKSFYGNFKRYKSPLHEFYEMYYEDYFKKEHHGRIGFYMYDAQHRYLDQFRGLILAEPFFSENCLILIDDTNSEDNRKATFDFIRQSEHFYELLFDERTFGNRHPTFWNGVIIFRKVSK